MRVHNVLSFLVGTIVVSLIGTVAFKVDDLLVAAVASAILWIGGLVGLVAIQGHKEMRGFKIKLERQTDESTQP